MRLLLVRGAGPILAPLHPSDMLALCLLQARPIDLNMPIKIVT